MKDIDNFNLEQFHKKIGNNVKQIRIQKGISQLALSHAIGHKSVSVVSYAEIYHKGYHFNLEHLGKIAYVLDVEISEFFK
ncbi:helix-turn-helix transcriptional regulator [Malaciobacter mytili]|uniref:helix-turn-helix transcriptional regulator n=1 Tax=Malaciobacter mytili TaxID=603050 RepID=UPI003BB2208D